MGNSQSDVKKLDVLNNIMGAPLDVLKIDSNKVIALLIEKKVPEAHAAKISEEIALKTITEVAGILALIPGLQVVGGVIGVICGLVDLLSTHH